MTSVALGLMFGLGLYLLWWSCWIEPPVDNRRERRAGPLTRLTDDIVQAGLRDLVLAVSWPVAWRPDY